MFKPKSKETLKNMEFTYSDFDFSHYIIDILFSDSCITSPHIQNDSFSLTLDAGPNVHLLYPDDFIEILECNLMKFPYLKSIIRDNKLSNIID